VQLRGEVLSDFGANCKLFFTKSGDLLVFLRFAPDFVRLGVAFGEILSNSNFDLNNYYEQRNKDYNVFEDILWMERRRARHHAEV
tara:strand:- start:42 stop:296 length:255 start_codon:yes stop_codon:yes gene_type:complete